MSRKSEFQAALKAEVAKMGGAHLTRETRERTVEKFADIMFAKGFTHLRSAADIGGKQLRAYVDARKEQSAGIRTMQNELAHLRSIIRKAGRPAVCTAPELCNAALGIGGGSRLGTKTAMTDQQLEDLCRLAAKQKRPGMAALLQLERRLGLRGAEAIHARLDTLERWQKEIESCGSINVIAGTKGGRRRVVSVHDRPAASHAITEALEVARHQAGFLVVRKDGSPAGGLKGARSIYHSWAFRSGIEPHSARYAFAQDQERGYIAAGFSPREALVGVSHDLGHGDGRGRWVKSVYMR